MSNLILAKQFSAGVDDQLVKPFSDYLRSIQFPHRVSEQHGKLLLWVYDYEHVTLIRELYQRFQQEGGDSIPPIKTVHSRYVINHAGHIIKNYPVTVLILLFCLMGYGIVLLGWQQAVLAFSFQGGYLIDPSGVFNQIFQGQYWRLFTPILLHFSWVHLGFNAVIFWFLARQIENIEGSISILSMTLLLALCSNIAQFLVQPHALFGGLSGVVYGLMAYCWIRNHLQPNLFYFPPGLGIIAIVMIAIGFTQVSTLFGVHMANWAHLMGFMVGALWAFIVANLPKLKP